MNVFELTYGWLWLAESAGHMTLVCNQPTRKLQKSLLSIFEKHCNFNVKLFNNQEITLLQPIKIATNLRRSKFQLHITNHPAFIAFTPFFHFSKLQRKWKDQGKSWLTDFFDFYVTNKIA